MNKIFKKCLRENIRSTASKLDLEIWRISRESLKPNLVFADSGFF